MSANGVQNASQPDNADASPSSDEDFDAAVAEFSGDQSEPDLSAADTSDPKEPLPGASESPAPADAAASKEPTAGAGAPPDQAKPQDDIWANADPALRKAHEDAIRDANLRFEGARGRQSASDRELQRLRAQLAERDRQQAGAGAGTGQPQGQGGQTADEPEVAEHLKQLREEYPEVAGPLLDEMARLRGTISQLQAPVGAMQQREAQAHYQAQENRLTELHPDWQATAQDDRFGGWLATQPQAIREAMERNFNAIVDGHEAALVIGKFKADLGIGAKPSEPDAGAIEAQDRRQRQLAAGRDTGRTGPSVTTGVPDDFDAAVDAFMPKG